MRASDWDRPAVRPLGGLRVGPYLKRGASAWFTFGRPVPFEAKPAEPAKVATLAEAEEFLRRATIRLGC